jgi:hypothetical protein
VNGGGGSAARRREDGEGGDGPITRRGHEDEVERGGEVWQQRGSALLDGHGGEQREVAERWKASTRQEGEAGARCNSGVSERPAGGGGWHVVT